LLTAGDGGFGGLDGGLLIGPQREPVGEGLVRKLFVRAVIVAFQECRESLRRIPAVEGVAKVFGTA
jgi:hypothetical protein